jgi:hypothetical protein
MFLLGAGIGPSLPLLPLIAQNMFGPKDIGVVTGSVTFFRTIGGAIGIAVLGTLFNHQLAANLSSIPSFNLPPAIVQTFNDPNVITSPARVSGVLAALPATIREPLMIQVTHFLALSKEAIASSVGVVFTASLALGGTSLLLFSLIKERELRGSHEPAETVAAETVPSA